MLTYRRLCALAAVLACAANAAALAAPPPASRTPPPSPFAGYPVKVACPKGVLMDVPPTHLPVGWTSTGHDVVVKELRLNTFAGQQMLECFYGSPSGSPEILTVVRRLVDPDACVLGPDKAWFLCKAGVQP